MSMLHEPSVETKPATFAERFCACYRINPADYEREMLRRSLYPTGKLVRFLMGSDANYFVPDREFIRGVGTLNRMHGFGAEVWAFTVNPENSRFPRLRLKMRVSAKRVYQQLHRVIHPDEPPPVLGNSIPPM